MVCFQIGAAIATIAPFVSVMLHERGLEPAAIGLVSSVSALGFTLAVPVWGHLGDVTLGRVRALQVAAIGAGIPVDIVLVVQSLIVLFIAAPPLVRAIFRLPAQEAK